MVSALRSVRVVCLLRQCTVERWTRVGFAFGVVVGSTQLALAALLLFSFRRHACSVALYAKRHACSAV
jgi:hypothetical protein